MSLILVGAIVLASSKYMLKFQRDLEDERRDQQAAATTADPSCLAESK